MVTSKELRKDQPSRPADIGVIEGRILGVWRNWDNVSVRCLAGKVILQRDSQAEELIHEARLVGGAYLLLTSGWGCSLSAFQIYSFKNKTWSRRHTLTTCDYAIAGIHPLSFDVAIRTENECTELWNLASQENVRTLKRDFDVFAFGREGSWAASDYQGLYFGKGDLVLRKKAAPENDEIVALEWFSPSQLVIGYWKAGVSIFDVETQIEKQIIECQSELLTIDVSLGIIAVQTGEKMFFFEEEEDRVSVVPDAFGFCFSKAESKIAILGKSGIRFIDGLGSQMQIE